jgi:hypothetical protein
MGNNKHDSPGWRALCAFAKNPNAYLYPDDPEPWEVITTKPPTKKLKRTRQRQLTLDRAMRQANKAGVAVKSATLTPDGVKLDLGDQANSDQPNPWDSVQ